MKNARIEEITNFLNTIQDYGVNNGAGPEPKSVENKDRKEKVKRYEKKIGSEDLIEIKGSVEIFDDKKDDDDFLEIIEEYDTYEEETSDIPDYEVIN